MAEIPKVKPGDAITAEWANALRAIATDLGNGMLTASLEQRIIQTVLSTLDPERFVLCKIVHVRLDTSVGPAGQRDPVSGASGASAYWPSQVGYHVKGVGKAGVDKDHLVPFYGREVQGDEARIYPAKVHMTCLLERDIDGEGVSVSRLYLLPGSERVARRKCGA